MSPIEQFVLPPPTGYLIHGLPQSHRLALPSALPLPPSPGHSPRGHSPQRHSPRGQPANANHTSFMIDDILGKSSPSSVRSPSPRRLDRLSPSCRDRSPPVASEPSPPPARPTPVLLAPQPAYHGHPVTPYKPVYDPSPYTVPYLPHYGPGLSSAPGLPPSPVQTQVYAMPYGRPEFAFVDRHGAYSRGE